MHYDDFVEIFNSNDPEELKEHLGYLLGVIEYTALNYEGMAEKEEDKAIKKELYRIAEDIKGLPSKAYEDYLEDIKENRIKTVGLN